MGVVFRQNKVYDITAAQEQAYVQMNSLLEQGLWAEATAMMKSAVAALAPDEKNPAQVRFFFSLPSICCN
jgi:hypothetical protein